MGRAPEAHSESLAREERLARRADFQHCYQRGLRRHGKYSILLAVPNQTGGPRLGITVSRKVGNAVVRNRARRRIREIYRRWKKRPTLPALDLVIHARPELGRASFGELKNDLERHFQGILASRANRGQA